MAVRIPDPVQLEREAVTYPPSRVVEYLQQVLTRRVVAYLAGLNDTKMVSAWARGEAEPRPAATMRLRYGYHAARIVAEAYDEETARSWFFGSNHLLDEEAPAYVLRHARSLDDVRLIIPAARSFGGSAG